MKRLIALSLALALSACVGTAEVRSIATLAVVCDAYATALRQATELRRAGKLPDEAVAAVNKANDVAGAACSSDSSINPADGVRVVRAAIETVKSITGGK